MHDGFRRSYKGDSYNLGPCGVQLRYPALLARGMRGGLQFATII